MRDPIATAIAISIGLVILAGYFLTGPLGALQATLLGWAVIVGAFAALVGITNLVLNHLRKLQHYCAGRFRRGSHSWSVFWPG
jgi:hypothetical protein